MVGRIEQQRSFDIKFLSETKRTIKYIEGESASLPQLTCLPSLSWFDWPYIQNMNMSIIIFYYQYNNQYSSVGWGINKLFWI
jgi:hypothetical protein